ncbi:MAG: hypothetical protein ACRCYY_09885 [Trueperaceae bacterium]
MRHFNKELVLGAAQVNVLEFPPVPPSFAPAKAAAPATEPQRG